VKPEESAIPKESRTVLRVPRSSSGWCPETIYAPFVAPQVWEGRRGLKESSGAKRGEGLFWCLFLGGVATPYFHKQFIINDEQQKITLGTPTAYYGFQQLGPDRTRCCHNPSETEST
jgi:hypothetical protein